MSETYKSIIYIFLLAIVGSFFILSFWLNLNIRMNSQKIVIEDPNIKENVLIKIALVGDIHLSDGEKSYNKLIKLLDEIHDAGTDIILFAGDYTSSPKKIVNIDYHRTRIVEILTKEKLSKKIFVLGNYESWSNYEAWKKEFEERKAILLENKVTIFDLKNQLICIRGFGDFYTRKYTYLDFPNSCNKKIKFSLTHDPAGAFDNRVKGLVLAAHTHCGQVRIPFYGALWIPSSAPVEATCGLYKDNQRTVFTTSGAGTTVFPVRVGTQSSWDLLEISFK